MKIGECSSVKNIVSENISAIKTFARRIAINDSWETNMILLSVLMYEIGNDSKISDKISWIPFEYYY